MGDFKTPIEKEYSGPLLLDSSFRRPVVVSASAERPAICRQQAVAMMLVVLNRICAFPPVRGLKKGR